MTIVLESSALRVSITPERGADIVQIVDLATQTPLLAVSPTGLVGQGAGPEADSMVRWLRGYPGGWQVLVPNAGPERDSDGVRQGFHGEAALATWVVLAQDAASCELETHLLTAPLRLRRSVSIDADTLTVTDVIENLSPDPVDTRIVQHPAFGSPFLDDRSYLVATATIATDADAPGTLSAPSVVGRIGQVLPAGPVPDSVRLPGPDAGESLFAALTDFAEHEVILCSPTRGLAVRLRWDGSVLPHAWFWIEANAGSGWPWFRRLYAVAIEPANVIPGEGSDSAVSRGGPGARLAGRASATVATSITRADLEPASSPSPRYISTPAQ